MANMFEFRNSASKVASIGPDRLTFRSKGLGASVAKFAAPFVDRILKLNRKQGFFSLNDQVRHNGLKKVGRFNATDKPEVLRTMRGIPSAMVIALNGATEAFLQLLDNWQIRHADAAEKLHSCVEFALLKSGDTNVSLAIEESSNVSNIHRASNEKLANSEKARCPVERRGRVTPNQARAHALGVRREQVPTAKAKICSELHRNMQKSAEMTDSTMYMRVTDYIVW
jgi:hypothetical protein